MREKKGSRYNRWYKMVRGRGESEHLGRIKKGSGKGFRMAEGVLGSKYRIDQLESEKESDEGGKEVR